MMGGLKVVFNPDKDRLELWLQEGQPSLSGAMLTALCDRVAKIDKSRLAGLPPGDRREIFERKIRAAIARQIVQIGNIQKGIELFKSTESQKIKLYHHG
jgi:hypothetical protein